MKRRLFVLFVAFVVLLYAQNTRVSAKASNVYHKIETSSDEKKIALTFDDGPHPRITREIISILKENEVTATFFVIGQNADNYPDTMKLLAQSGYEIGNHTYSHKNLKKMSEKEVKEEFRRCSEALLKFGVEPTLMRPPEGFFSDDVIKVSRGMEYDIILWSIDTRDWAHTPSSNIVKNVLENARGGDIILMHDYLSGYGGTCEALRTIIPELKNRGFEFVTVSELISDNA